MVLIIIYQNLTTSSVLNIVILDNESLNTIGITVKLYVIHMGNFAIDIKNVGGLISKYTLDLIIDDKLKQVICYYSLSLIGRSNYLS